MGGGLGDTFMFSRFIPLLCERNKDKDNKIVFFVNHEIYWIYNQLFRTISNLQVVSYNEPYLIGDFDYHCNLLSLLKYLNITYESLSFSPQFTKIESKSSNTNKLSDIIPNYNPCNKTYIINWKGNSLNPHEKHNRQMNLKYAEPLFKLENINWLVISKNITNEERELLCNNNVTYIGDNIDNSDKAFEESITIMRQVDGVISTDTSIAHLSANLDIKTFVLLTLGCEWRWNKLEKKTNWYPESILIKQKELKNWKTVIDELIELL